MAGNGLRKEVRRRLCAFAGRVARYFFDSRRQRFVQEIVAGLVIGGQAHLAKIVRAVGSGMKNVLAAKKRLRHHLHTPHWSVEPAIDKFRGWSAEMVDGDLLIVVDVTEVAKDCARSSKRLGPMRQNSSCCWYCFGDSKLLPTDAVG